MKFILIAVLTNTSLGEFNSIDSCNNAIRDIYSKSMYINNDNRKIINDVINTTMFYQKEYVCVKK